MSKPYLQQGQILLIVATLAGGLALDMHTNIVGQTLLSFMVWLTLLHLMRGMERDLRFGLMSCLVIATAGEMFLSLFWGLYTYRLGNVPLFVPPGHVLLLLLGFAFADRMPDVIARAIIGCAAAYSFVAALLGIDTLGIPLFLVLFATSLLMPAQRRLYASTFMLSLALELYGTSLGNWAWAHKVPGMALVTTNPPGVSGAFYCALDALVMAVLLTAAPRLNTLAAGRSVDASSNLSLLPGFSLQEAAINLPHGDRNTDAARFP